MREIEYYRDLMDVILEYKLHYTLLYVVLVNLFLLGLIDLFIVFNATFSNISAYSC